jgi:hypothetical protein
MVSATDPYGRNLAFLHRTSLELTPSLQFDIFPWAHAHQGTVECFVWTMRLSTARGTAKCAVTQDLFSILMTDFTRTLQLSFVWDRPILFIPPYTFSPRSVLILSIHLSLRLHSGLFPSANNYICAFLFSPFRFACPSDFFVLGLFFSIILGKEHKLWSSSLCSFLHPPPSSSLFGQNVLLVALLSNTFSSSSCLCVRKCFSPT